MHLCDAHHALLHTEFCRIEDDRRRRIPPIGGAMSPQGRWMRRVRCMPCAAPCLRASTLAQIGPPHPSDSIMGGPRSADPEEKREPCERHPKTPIDGRNSEVLDIERPNREGMQSVCVSHQAQSNGAACSSDDAPLFVTLALEGRDGSNFVMSDPEHRSARKLLS